MRLFFVLLLLVNMLLAGWGYWHQQMTEHAVEPPAAITATVQGDSLYLLKEKPATPRQKIAVSEQAVPPAGLVEPIAESVAEGGDEERPHTESIMEARCYRIADIPGSERRDGLAGKITAISMAVIEQGEEFKERQNYWVYIPPLKSSAAAREVTAALAKAKVRDYLLVRSGELENAISLGLFSQRDGAENRLEEILALRLKMPRPVMSPRNSTYRSYWLIIKDREGEGENRLMKLLETEKESTTGVDCPV